MNINELQRAVNVRWEKQLGNPCHQSADSTHMIVHINKALGKVADKLNDAEHAGTGVSPEDVRKQLADLVICTTRLAQRMGVDLDAACVARLAEKFPAE